MFEQLTERLEGTFRRLRGKGTLSEENVRDALKEVRRALLEADVNYKVAKRFVRSVEERAIGREVLEGLTPGQAVVGVIYEELTALMGGEARRLRGAPTPPAVVLLVGLQGSGKTSFAGKLALSLRREQKRVQLAACDVYRPAAIDQLETVGREIDVPVHADRTTTDVVAIAKGAFARAREKAADYLLVDTAGRMHVDGELMQELRRLKEAIEPTEILLVVDGMTGQDAVTIGETFEKELGIDGVVLTKMDGDARGGAALSLRAVVGKPIFFVAHGEKPSDLLPFHPDRMAQRILGMGDVLSLVEKTQAAVDEKQTAKLEEKLRTQSFTLEDFLDQLRQIQKMGPIEDLLKMIPGVGAKMKDVHVDPKELGRIEAIILSMTPGERRRPKAIDASRRKRISKGSGTTVADVNRLLKRFGEMQKMMKSFGKLPKRMRRGLPFPG